LDFLDILLQTKVWHFQEACSVETVEQFNLREYRAFHTFNGFRTKLQISSVKNIFKIVLVLPQIAEWLC